MMSVKVESGLLFKSGEKRTNLDDVYLVNSRIGGQLSFNGAKFGKHLHIESCYVGQNLILDNVLTEDGAISVIDCQIMQNFCISRGEFGTVILTGSRVEQLLELQRDGEAIKWKDGANLGLRNVKVGGINDLPNSWPEKAILVGFEYDLTGGDHFTAGKDIVRRSTQWFKDWLKQSPYSPQIYAHLANQFKRLGFEEKGDKILFFGRERERNERLSGVSWLWSTMNLILIGHGYKIHFALWWTIGLICLGAAILKITGEGVRNSMPIGLSYSIDMILPVIQLRRFHYENVQLRGIARYYFYVHKIMGYVLATFLIAGLSGLTR
jgi:hypothetical protein